MIGFCKEHHPPPLSRMRMVLIDHEELFANPPLLRFERSVFG
jgi:hypothetical protein